jgi:hypothetical protein
MHTNTNTNTKGLDRRRNANQHAEQTQGDCCSCQCSCSCSCSCSWRMMHGLGSLGMSTTNDTRADCAQTQRTGGSSHGVTDDVSVLGFWFKQSVSDVCNHIEYVWIEFRWRGTSEFEMSESVISLPLHSSTGIVYRTILVLLCFLLACRRRCATFPFVIIRLYS